MIDEQGGRCTSSLTVSETLFEDWAYGVPMLGEERFTGLQSMGSSVFVFHIIVSVEDRSFMYMKKVGNSLV